ncbi:MAG: MBL fold metallo-hydrolase [Cyclobacteriaceae bacterium]|nr:MBL fold metallo-hydrolase [Cyclobacteriaceae bacterium]
MSLFVASLNSGSNGNCYYLGNEEEGVLIDVGISCREVEKRLKRLDIPVSRIKAVFITHEHNDHIHGVPAFTKKHKLPVFTTEGTILYGNLGNEIERERINVFRPYQSVKIGNISVTAFPITHDANDPHNFIVASDSVTVGIFTDIGFPCYHVTQHFAQCHAAFLESNYDEHMLEFGSYPYQLKNRIRGGKGHLSNRQALKLFLDYRPAFMTHLFLSHLSQNNNSPDIVEEVFSGIAHSTHIAVMSRDRESSLYLIENNLGLRSKAVRPPVHFLEVQLSLFQ